MTKNEKLLADTLAYVLDAHRFDGAMTMGTASLSPAIEAKIRRTLAEVRDNVSA
jgi:hypothetical protein